MRLSLLAILALIVVPFAGCGYESAKKPSGDTPSEKPAGETPADKPAEAPQAAAQDGAESPEALIEQMKGLQDSDDFSIMVPLVQAKDRGMLAFAMGMMAPSMTIAMGEAMAGMAGGGDPEKAAEAKSKFDAMKTGYEALLKKHGLPTDMTAAMGEMQSMQDDPAAAVAAMSKMFEGVDHAAFINESMAFMKSQKDGDEKGGMSMDMKDNFAMEDVEIKVDGDTAIATAKGKDKPLNLIKVDGRWYIDFLASMQGGR